MRKWWQSLSQQLKVSIILALIAGLFGIISNVVGPFTASVIGHQQNSGNTQSNISINVRDYDGNSVTRAKIILFSSDGSFDKYTDSSGAVNFITNSSGHIRLVIETAEYEIFERELVLPVNELVTIQLQKRPNEIGSFIIHVVGLNSLPVTGADVNIIIGADTYNQITDSNGVAKFTIPFFNDIIDAQVSVNAKNFKYNNQRLAIQINKSQDIQLSELQSLIIPDLSHTTLLTNTTIPPPTATVPAPTPIPPPTATVPAPTPIPPPTATVPAPTPVLPPTATVSAPTHIVDIFPLFSDQKIGIWFYQGNRPNFPDPPGPNQVILANGDITNSGTCHVHIFRTGQPVQGLGDGTFELWLITGNPSQIENAISRHQQGAAADAGGSCPII